MDIDLPRQRRINLAALSSRSKATGGDTKSSMSARIAADDAAPSVRDVLPRLARGISQELHGLGDELAAQVDGRRVRGPCACDDELCQSFCTEFHPPGTRYEGEHRTVPLHPEDVMVNLDVVDGRIVYMELSV
jgi:hypothetical protein